MYGIDLSDAQLKYAHSKTKGMEEEISSYKGTMDELSFKNDAFDIVVTSVAFCETDEEVRRGSIKETSRVLRNGGYFALIDCARPRVALTIVILPPFFMLKTNEDNWNNTYVEPCKNNGLVPYKEDYLKSYMKCQLFKKE